MEIDKELIELLESGYEEIQELEGKMSERKDFIDRRALIFSLFGNVIGKKFERIEEEHGQQYVEDLKKSMVDYNRSNAPIGSTGIFLEVYFRPNSMVIDGHPNSVCLLRVNVAYCPEEECRGNKKGIRFLTASHVYPPPTIRS